MPLLDISKWVVAALLTATLCYAAFSDIRARTIPNWTVLAVVGLFAPWALLHWGTWAAWSLAAGAIALVIGIGLYAAGVVGAGDAKLFAAVALFAGFGDLLMLGFTTAIVGGVIAVASLAASPHRALTMFTLRGAGDYGRGVPYGVAIAAAGSMMVWGGLWHLRAPFNIVL